MGYSFNKEFTIGCSDKTSDFHYTLIESLIEQMKEEEKDVGPEYCNTPGILNVAIVLQECFNDQSWGMSILQDYVRGFIARFESWIEREEASLC